MPKQKTGLFIGRFQPGMHVGQIDALKQAMAQGVHHFLIGVGSSNKEFTRENPFTYDERKAMIELSLKDVKGMSYQIFPLPDMDNDKAWKQYICDNLLHFDVVITGNSRVRKIFEKSHEALSLGMQGRVYPSTGSGGQTKNTRIIWLKIRVPMKGTFLRDQIALGRTDELKKALSTTVVAYLNRIKASARMMKFFHQDRWTPYLCVDVIFKDMQGNLVLIERKNYPYGVALPGGFVDYGEDPQAAAVREVKEEVGAKIKIKKLLGVYGDPKRDPRAHNVTIVYEGEYVSGVLKAGDDAKRVVKFKVPDGIGAGSTLKSKKDLNKINFCFDHKKIILDYINTCNWDWIC